MSRLLRVTEYAAIMVERFKNQEGVAVDMTLGNGNDCELLAQSFSRVLAFDIQESAIIKSKDKLKEYSNIDYYLDSHENIDKYLNEPVDLFIYNLGYLPNDNKHITTTSSSTINSLKKALTYLKKQGLIIISVYPGHEEGYNEALALEEFIKRLEDNYQISYYKLSNKNSPYVICLNKLK